MPKDGHFHLRLPKRQCAQSLALLLMLLGAGCSREQPAHVAVEGTKPAAAITVNLLFRFKATEGLLQDIDPPRIAAAIRGLDRAERFKVFDDRASDATFVTLVIAVPEPDAAHLAALHRALTSIPRVTAYTVDSSGALTPLDRIPPDLLVEVARTDVKLD